MSRFADDSFDITLVFGHLYHLYAEEDVHRALDEALRVTRAGSVMLTAFLSVYAILYDNDLNDRLAEGREDFSMSDEAFAAFTRHHLATCEKRELLGCSSHLLHICRKGIAHGNHN